MLAETLPVFVLVCVLREERRRKAAAAAAAASTLPAAADPLAALKAANPAYANLDAATAAALLQRQQLLMQQQLLQQQAALQAQAVMSKAVKSQSGVSLPLCLTCADAVVRCCLFKSQLCCTGRLCHTVTDMFCLQGICCTRL